MVCEAIEKLTRRQFSSQSDVTVTILHRSVHDFARQSGHSEVFDELQSLYDFRVRRAVVVQSMDQPARRRDFPELAAEPDILPVWSLQKDAPFSSDPQIDHAVEVKAFRVIPAPYVI
jgi:hypothetical protein